jgi:hypothetical protein
MLIGDVVLRVFIFLAFAYLTSEVTTQVHFRQSLRN